MKRIEELKTIKGDAYDYYAYPNEDDDLFEKIFLVGEIVDEIKRPSKCFLIGEKGAGKTAYSVYMCKKENPEMKCSISMVNDLLYRKFLNMKKNGMLDLSEMKDIWVNLLYLVIAEKLCQASGSGFFSQIRMKKLKEAIDQFYSNAFKPELVNAFEFVQNASNSINVMASKGLFSIGGSCGDEIKQKYEEQSYQISLLKIQKGFEDAFEELKINFSYILFVDGIDGRPSEIDNKDYFECITGLVDCVLEINRGVLGKKGIKVMPLMRPDVMYRIPIQNMNQKVRDNAVLLNWDTSYTGYVRSKLFKIADDYFSKQQKTFFELGENWNYYFPYKINKSHSGRKWKEEDAFVEFLRYSSYKPRDILTMLNEMVRASSGERFVHDDFVKMLNNYEEYLEGELKDYLLIYMNEGDYENFRILFDYFHGCNKFNYEEFKSRHTKYIQYLRSIGRNVPTELDTPQKALQLLYDANLIGYFEEIETPNGKIETRYHWSCKERSYANIRPSIKTNERYTFHIGYARTLGIR
ncbi:P-loop ATPase, Sll1717 family [Butyrivibrio sp. XPD2002]|uniref:P-loop ATPase, Sll1717 family n=1 Tax=Butyrivibrio sp. XPD2002 TaxID=1280665 RepID=UPI000429ED77|nr:hypothetical protein [Butyrivibrio sp. XPD2002]